MKRIICKTKDRLRVKIKIDRIKIGYNDIIIII